MIGVPLAISASFFDEGSISIGKQAIQQRKQCLYTMGFLNQLWALVLFGALVAFAGRPFTFLPASYPFFAVRILLDMFQAWLVMNAIAKAERSAFGFIRTVTIPLLLLIDVLLGYALTNGQMAGMALIIFSLALLFVNHGIKREGTGYVLASAVNAAFTISLYKYNIAHYNSVEAEQIVGSLFLLAFLFFMAMRQCRENPLRVLLKRFALAQSFSHGIAAVLDGFAYNFAPASVIVAATRSSSVFWSVAFGNVVFHEKHLLLKAFALLLCVTGIILLLVT